MNIKYKKVNALVCNKKLLIGMLNILTFSEKRYLILYNIKLYFIKYCNIIFNIIYLIVFSETNINKNIEEIQRCNYK